jgi:hypothetical protein
MIRSVPGFRDCRLPESQCSWIAVFPGSSVLGFRGSFFAGFHRSRNTAPAARGAGSVRSSAADRSARSRSAGGTACSRCARARAVRAPFAARPVRQVRDLLRQPDVGPRLVPIIPDEARTFGMDALFREIKIYSPHGQRYEPVDQQMLPAYLEATNGQILHEGIIGHGQASLQHVPLHYGGGIGSRD